MFKSFIFGFILGITLGGCCRAINTHSPIIRWFYSDYYDEKNNTYRLNWLQELTLEDVVLVEKNRKVKVENEACTGIQLIGKIFFNYSGHRDVTTTVITGQFAKKYKKDDHAIYLDVVSETRTFVDSTVCVKD